jgi:hypothetical protein
MPAMQRLCTRAILLKGGRIIEDGDTSDVVMSYLSHSSGEQNQAPHREARAAGQKSEEIALRSWSIQSAGQGPHMLASGQDLAIDLQLDFRRSLEDCAFGLAIWTDEGILAWSGTTNDLTGFQGDFPKGNHTVTIRIRKFSLKPGRYRIETSVDSRGLRLDRWHLVPELTILPNRATSLVPEWQGLTTFDFSVNSQPSHVPDHAMRPMVATDAGGDPAPYS